VKVLFYYIIIKFLDYLYLNIWEEVVEAAPTLDAAPYQTVMESHVVHQDAAHYQVVMDAVLAVEAVYQVAKDVALQDAAHYQAVVDVEAAQAACQAVEAVATAYPAKTAVKKITDTNQI